MITKGTKIKHRFYGFDVVGTVLQEPRGGIVLYERDDNGRRQWAHLSSVEEA